VTSDDELAQDTAEDLFEHAPCGYITTRLDGTILKVNRTFESWTGLRREDLLAGRRFQELLSPGGRIYHETHYAPLLRMQGAAREVAVEIVRADGSRLPALINSVVLADADGRPRVIRTTVFDATDRRRYEQELLRAQRREHEIAQRLQQSMLSGALPQADGVDLHAAYVPAVSGLDVGGDWYDAFWLDEGDAIGLVVGDVVGRGIEAAATMGQLRSAVRALASTGLPPARLLEALDGYARRHELGQMATLVIAQLRLSSGALAYACAGHPPPVVMRPGEPPQLIWDGRSLPLDAQLTTDRPREEGACRLPSGSALLLYTDGLVERRSKSISAGMDELLVQAAAHRSEPASTLADALVRALVDGEHHDDVCLLALTRAAADQEPVSPAAASARSR
jgi:sigma-B regulation protein RsbU (phosphoserine phosphatase)